MTDPVNTPIWRALKSPTYGTRNSVRADAVKDLGEDHNDPNSNGS